jgi:hypothetical protein
MPTPTWEAGERSGGRSSLDQNHAARKRIA